ncbi:hypothetical protein V2G26_007218 [Clonostachys chloroleuca]
MEDTSVTITAMEEGREQASASTLDSQDLMDAVQMLCKWCPGYCPIKSLSRKMRSFLALIRIATPKPVYLHKTPLVVLLSMAISKFTPSLLSPSIAPKRSSGCSLWGRAGRRMPT